jgi:hypothetical protein
MVTGFVFVLLGLLILYYPQILIAMVAGLFIMFGVGMMLASWQFRRMRKSSASRFVNWIIRY